MDSLNMTFLVEDNKPVNSVRNEPFQKRFRFTTSVITSKLSIGSATWFQASFRRVLGCSWLGGAWWIFESPENLREFTRKIIKHQVTSTLKTLRKLPRNHLTVLWLNFERNRRFLFVLPGPTPTYKVFGLNFWLQAKSSSRKLFSGHVRSLWK